MNFADWYTDLMDVWRVQTVMDGSLTRHERVQVYAGIPCRVYQSDNRAVNLTQTASDVHQEDRLACGLNADVQAGDELIITRGARLGHKTHVVRAFASDPNPYYEPFGAVIPGLAHQEIRLRQQERVKGGVSDEQQNQHPEADQPAAQGG